jgi:hypothetical protein
MTQLTNNMKKTLFMASLMATRLVMANELEKLKDDVVHQYNEIRSDIKSEIIPNTNLNNFDIKPAPVLGNRIMTGSFNLAAAKGSTTQFSINSYGDYSQLKVMGNKAELKIGGIIILNNVPYDGYQFNTNQAFPLVITVDGGKITYSDEFPLTIETLNPMDLEPYFVSRTESEIIVGFREPE